MSKKKIITIQSDSEEVDNKENSEETVSEDQKVLKK